MATLYRAVSRAEYVDYQKTSLFSTTENTLEAKQFFKSRAAVKEFVTSAIEQAYHPPYSYLLILTVDDALLSKIRVDTMQLDGFEAISVREELLPAFNKCVNFVKVEKL